tara:strand:+ start:2980 stop:3966 length:987 start_codon:yes stop_codon:yes gene_type:complete
VGVKEIKRLDMKIALILIDPNISVPPKGWGAIEKYMWEYKVNLEKLGHQVELCYPNSTDLDTFDIVQVHTSNQALYLAQRGIPYIFSFDDTHAVYYGKDSELYKNNLKAIEQSELSIMHGEFLLDYFDSDKMVYLEHGANPNTFRNINPTLTYQGHKLLCVGRTDQDDRKGIILSIEVAKELNLPITIVGPNEEFFSNNNIKYDKLTIIGNQNDDELVKLYNEHTIFLHPSKLETGQPNLTLIESIYCGTPVVGTCDIEILGMRNIQPTKESLIEGVNDVINNFDDFQKQCFDLKDSKIYDWHSITKKLITLIKPFFIRKHIHKLKVK